MKLLFDQNLSYRLVHLLSDLFPDSEHVRNVGLKDADDAAIWEHAKRGGYMIVSKDTDFHQRSFLFGHPPKVIWIRLGNCSTNDVEAVLRKHISDIASLRTAGNRGGNGALDQQGDMADRHSGRVRKSPAADNPHACDGLPVSRAFQMRQNGGSCLSQGSEAPQEPYQE